jgi:hypothetical protein
MRGLGSLVGSILPSGLIADALHLTENGTSINYINERSGHLQRTPSQWVAIVVVAGTSIASMAAGATAAERRARRQRG